MKILVALYLMVLCAAVANAQNYTITSEGNGYSIQPSLPKSSSGRVTVQKVNKYRFWREDDQRVIDVYLACHPKLSRDNKRCLAIALPQLVGAGIIDARKNGCLVLNQEPRHYFAMIQVYYGMLNGLDWYVNVPAPEPCPPLPEFTCEGSQGALQLGDVPDCQLTPAVCPPTRPSGGYQFFRPGERRERTIGGVFFRPDKDCEPKDETCGPGQPPPPPPPGGGGTKPGGPPTTPPPGGGTGGHGTGGAPWDPSPSHPRVADPVN